MGGLNLFEGRIGEVRIYNRALSLAEIAAIYQNPYDLWMPVGEMAMDDVAVGHPALRRHGALPDSMIYHRQSYARWG